MKVHFSVFFVLFVSNLLFAQSAAIDSLFRSDGQLELVVVKEVRDDQIVFQYPGESIPYKISPQEIDRIVFRSGRTQEFNAALANYEPVKSVLDWEKVVVIDRESEVAGMERVDIVAASRTGATVFSNSAALYEKTMEMMKKQAAGMGANVIFLRDDQMESINVFQRAKAGASGTAYTTELPDAQQIKPGIYRTKQAYVIPKNSPNFFPYSDFPIRTLKLGPDMLQKQGDYYYLTLKGLIRNNILKHRVISVDADVVVLQAENKNGSRLYNMFLELE